MTPIPVIWLSLHEGIDARGPWDTRILERLFEGSEWSHGLEFQHWQQRNNAIRPTGERVIVVLPARHHVDDVDEINQHLAMFDSVLLILCGDEEGKFPWKDIRHPNIRFWVQMPDPTHYADLQDAFFFGNGPANVSSIRCAKTQPWMFVGQETNSRRKAAIAGLRKLGRRMGGRLTPTSGFAQGDDPEMYARALQATWFAPAPSGPEHVDTFRAYEALEAGCIPLVDGATPQGQSSYWLQTYDEVPFPIIDDWDTVGGWIEHLYKDRHFYSARCSAWWQQRKREMAWRLRSDLRKLGHEIPEQKVTAIITTSPTPGNDLAVIQETIGSIRHHFGEIEIIVACDGVRPEQEHLGEKYDEYLYRLCRWTEDQSSIVPYVAAEWRHQAMLTFEALTELGFNRVLLFCEHDTPLVTDMTIDVDKAIETIDLGMLDVLRFHHESRILEPHEHLMVDHVTVDLCGLPVRRTRQYSQRPHLASASYYVKMLGSHFTRESRTMIEDRLHSVCQTQPWSSNRLAIYHPEGNIQRSYHLDARGSEDKFPMVY